MKILAIERELKNTDWNRETRILENEARQVYQLYLAGFIREIYFNGDHNAVIILECESIEAADKLLNSLPLVKEGLISFQIMQLLPYSGYDRILKHLVE